MTVPSQQANGTKAKRKLVKPTTMMEVRKRLNYGVSLPRIISDLKLDISRPALQKLLTHYEKIRLYANQGQIYLSLFPNWIDQHTTAPSVQTNPDDWRYIGRFPNGEWRQD